MVRDLTARANKLHDDLRTRLTREKARRAAALEDLARHTAEARVQAETESAAARNSTRLNYEHRKVRIGKACQSSKEKGLAKIEDQTGARKYEFQKTMLQAEHDRESGLAANAKRFEEFKAALAAEAQTLSGLEQGAQRGFRGYWGFRRLFAGAYQKVQADLAPHEDALLEQLRQSSAKAAGHLKRFRWRLLLHLFRYWPLWLLAALCPAPLVLLLRHLGLSSIPYPNAAEAGAAAFVVLFALRHLAARRARPLAASLAGALATARLLHNAARQKAEAHFQQELQRLQDQYQNTLQGVDQQLKQVLAKAGESRVSCRLRLDEKTVRASAALERLHALHVERLAQRQAQATERLDREAEAQRRALLAASDQRDKQHQADYESAWTGLAAEWQGRLQPLYAAFDGINAFSSRVFPPWTDPVWKHWAAPDKFSGAARFGRLAVDVARLCEGLPKDPRLALPGPDRFDLALCLAYPEQGSILFETAETGHDNAIGALNGIILRLLATAPPGRLNFSIIDPVGLGQNFAGVMHLADYEEADHQQPHLDPKRPDRAAPGRPQRAHGEGHPDVPAQ